MALPWLIGALVVGAVGAIANAVGGDDSSSSSNSSSNSGSGRNEAEERRRRDAAEQKRHADERDKRRVDARAEFAQRGATLGRNLADSLQELVQVEGMGMDAFLARLTVSGYRLQAARRGGEPVAGLLNLSPELDGKMDQTLQNLDFFGAAFDVRLQGSRKLHAVLGELNGLTAQSNELASLKRRIRKLERGIAARNA